MNSAQSKVMWAVVAALLLIVAFPPCRYVVNTPEVRDIEDFKRWLDDFDKMVPRWQRSFSVNWICVLNTHSEQHAARMKYPLSTHVIDYRLLCLELFVLLAISGAAFAQFRTRNGVQSPGK